VELKISDWHIVQVSSVFHSQNRHGSTMGSTSKAPAIFISAFTTIGVSRLHFLGFLVLPIFICHCHYALLQSNLIVS